MVSFGKLAQIDESVSVPEIGCTGARGVRGAEDRPGAVKKGPRPCDLLLRPEWVREVCEICRKRPSSLPVTGDIQWSFWDT